MLTKIFRRLLAIIYKGNGSFDSVLSVSNDFNVPENETSIYSLIFPIQKQIKKSINFNSRPKRLLEPLTDYKVHLTCGQLKC